MPRTTNPLFIDWLNSESRKLVLEDLRTGTLGLTEEETSSVEAFEYYRHHPTFIQEEVCFEQFAARLRDHRQQIGDRVRRAQWDASAMHHDKMNHPYPTHNHRGEPNFHLSAAEDLLRADVRAGLHLGLFPSELRSTRPEYMIFKPKKFKQVLYQTVRHVKFRHFIETQGRTLPFDYWPAV